MGLSVNQEIAVASMDDEPLELMSGVVELLLGDLHTGALFFCLAKR